MEIDSNFSLYGFEQKNYGLGGMAFFRYELPKDEKKREPTIRDDNYYGGYGDSLNYRISIPKAPQKILTGTVLITRQSKNRYSLAMQSAKRVQIVPLATSLTKIRELVTEFFKETDK